MDEPGPAPVSWLQIEPGWTVVTADGVALGTVAQVAGSKQADIFDGLAVERANASQLGYVAGEQVALIYPGTVNLKIDAAGAADLPPYSEAAPQTTFSPEDGSLLGRLSRFFRGR